jgi:VanZ family protein
MVQNTTDRSLETLRAPGLFLPAPVRLISWVLAVGSTLVILVACFFPARAFPKVHTVDADKLVHAAMFLIWALAWLAAVGKGYFRLVVVLLAGILFAALTEVAQGYLPWRRSADWWDWAADVLGVALACAGWWVVGRYAPQRKRATPQSVSAETGEHGRSTG